MPDATNEISIAYRFIEFLPEPAFALDENGQVISWNRPMELLTGVPGSEMIGKSNYAYAEPFYGEKRPLLIDLVFKPDELLEQHYAPILRLADSITAENIILPDQRRLWAKAGPLLDSQGRVRGAVEIIRDITEDVQVKAALYLSEERYRKMSQSATEGIFRTTLDGTFLCANPFLAKISGYSSPWEVIESITNVKEMYVRPEERVAFVDYLLTHDNLEGYEVELLCKDGSTCWHSINAHTVRNENGHLLYFEGTTTDITSRKQAEKALRESEARYRLIAENVIDVIAVYDLDLVYTYVSPSVERLTGYTPQELIGKSVFSLVEEQWQDKIRDVLAQTRDSIYSGDPHLASRSWTVELQRVFKDGKPMWNETTFSFLMDNDGIPQGIISVTRDISARKKVEEQMAYYQEHLQHGQKLEAIGTLAGGIAHDFNNILSIIIGCSEMIRDNITDAGLNTEMIAHVLKASERAKDLVQQILTFSSQVEGEKQAFDIHLVVNEALKLLRPTIPSTIRISKEIDSTSGTVLADSTQIHQVVMNLCTNAYQAMENKEGVIDVALHPVTVDEHLLRKHPDLHLGEYIMLRVSDTGCGMDATTMQRVFDPFFTTKANGKGTGLGLAISHGIVKKLGGVIIPYSSPGEGSTFEVYFPRFAVDMKSALSELEEVPSGNGERILLVDDEPDIIAYTSCMLQQSGYIVHGYDSSLNALESFCRTPHNFDLIITDQTMPEMCGDQLAMAVHTVRPEIPVVVMTGYNTIVSQENSSQLGIKEIVYKPFSRSRMARTVHSVLSETKGCI